MVVVHIVHQSKLVELTALYNLADPAIEIEMCGIYQVPQ